MLIIFDLDDTLIDTTGVFIPAKMKEVVGVLNKEGLNVDYEKLLEINQNSTSGHDAFEKLICGFDLSEPDKVHYLKIATGSYYNTVSSVIVVPLFDGTFELLGELSENHKLALVTFGNDEVQNKKLNDTNIRGFFSKIFVTDSYNKGHYYKELAQEFGCDASEVVVVGDKFATDLHPAKVLGMKTVRVKTGRANHRGIEDADHVIENVVKLREVLN